MSSTPSELIYQKPKLVTDIRECHFYHSMSIPGYGEVQGEWDLRGHEDDYLGGVNFSRKRVLEVGTASGYLCFHMEKKGADMVAYDLSRDYSWDAVPFHKESDEEILRRRAHVDKVNNAFWFCHRAFNSKARMCYGTVYSIPEKMAKVDIATFCSVLLHVRDPFLALQNALRLTGETVIVTEATERTNLVSRPLNWLTGKIGKAYMRFAPNPITGKPTDTWWGLTPQIVRTFIEVLGFEETKVTYHRQRSETSNRTVKFFTVVGHRTSG